MKIYHDPFLQIRRKEIQKQLQIFMNNLSNEVWRQ